MDSSDFKKDVTSTADDIFGQAKNTAKTVGTNITHDFMGDDGGNSPIHAADNAHTEHYFANEQKDLDFEHLDPQAFVQRMSAGAKEAQEQLDAKFAKPANQFDDFLTESTKNVGAFGNQFKQDVKQGLGNVTNDFMNVERGLFGGSDVPAQPNRSTPPTVPPTEPVLAPAPPVPAAATTEVRIGDLLGGLSGSGEAGHLAATAPTAPLAPIVSQQQFYNDDDWDPEPLPSTKSSSASNKDSDTEGDSTSVSYNQSPVKKNPVTDALKEQDNEKFISSEDLLSDYKDERTATPDFKTASTTATLSAAAAEIVKPSTKTTLIDDDYLATNTSRGVPATPPGTPATPAPQATIQTKPSLPVVNEPKIPTGVTAKETVAPKEDVKPTTTPTTTPANVVDKQPQSQPQRPTEGQTGQPKIVSVEEIFYKYGLDAWFKPERLHPQVESLIYWRDLKKSGIVFGVGLVILLAISCFSVISVFAYASLLALAGAIVFRVYKSVMQAVQKTPEGHPFKDYLDLDLTVSQEKAQNFVSVAVAHLNGFVTELRRLFLVEDLVDSIKFGVILWVFTYIGAWFNGMTLVILGFVSLFTLPKVYENNKQSIDTYLDLVRSKFTEITDKIKVAIPIGNKKPVEESDKDK